MQTLKSDNKTHKLKWRVVIAGAVLVLMTAVTVVYAQSVKSAFDLGSAVSFPVDI